MKNFPIFAVLFVDTLLEQHLVNKVITFKKQYYEYRTYHGLFGGKASRRV